MKMKMKKSIEIEIPDGKVEQISRDGDTISIKFVDVDICERVKTLKDAATIAKSLYPEIYNKWAGTRPGSYVEKLYAYRMVVAVLTNNEKNSLTTGNRFYPFVQFCEPDKVKKCAGNVVVGHIEEDGRKFAVVGGHAHFGGSAGLGGFHSCYGVSYSAADVGFRSVSSERVAKYLSEQFGRLLFEIHYGGTNCNWKWLS